MFIIWDLVNWRSSPPSYNINGAGYLVLTASKFPTVTLGSFISMKPGQLSCRLLVLPRKISLHKTQVPEWYTGNSVFVFWVAIAVLYGCQRLCLRFLYTMHTLKGTRKFGPTYIYIMPLLGETSYNRSYLSMCHCKTNLSVYM